MPGRMTQPPKPALPLPLSPLAAVLSMLMRSTLRRHPAILGRMGAAAGARFLIDVTDVPVQLLIEPALRRARVLPRSACPAHDAAIRGRLSAFLSMLHGAEDGDALFFSGELTIGGDTAAVLALRNALDDAEIDLTEEIAGLAPAAGPLARHLSGLLERRTGLSLHRVTETEIRQ